MERLYGAGDIAAEIPDDRAPMQAIIRDTPGLKWKPPEREEAPRYRRWQQGTDRVACIREARPSGDFSRRRADRLGVVSSFDCR